MQSDTRLSGAAVNLLRCPACHANLLKNAQSLDCTNIACGATYPIVARVPILINDRASVFAIEDFVENRQTTFLRARTTGWKKVLEQVLGTDRYTRLKATVRRALPTIDAAIGSERNYAQLAELLLKKSPTPRVLVLGGGILGGGMQALIKHSNIDFVESDVAIAPRTAIVCDAHDIPFRDGSFDAVIAQAVLEHVTDPFRCAEEIHRVLAKDGFIYSETPFMQQVHAGRYDFTRFTHLGHRRLFRRFEEISSGAVCGPGMALAWSYQYFLLSFVTSQNARTMIKVFCRWTAFFWKYFDYFLIDKKGTYDCASGFFLLGKKAEQAISDKDLIRLYRGVDS